MLLEVDGVTSGYHGLAVLHDVSLTVDSGEIVAIVGANGAGKSTLLKSIVGEVKRSCGSVVYDGQSVHFGESFKVARRGLMLVPEHRALFGDLTVEENLQMGTWGKGARHGFSRSEVLEIFPVLAERGAQTAETMSGGQQQMLAIARALMGAPQLLLLDEPSTGLSPKLTWTVFEAIDRIRERGIGVLIVEQNARQVLSLADRAYVLDSGVVALEGFAHELAKDDQIQAAYLGG